MAKKKKATVSSEQEPMVDDVETGSVEEDTLIVEIPDEEELPLEHEEVPVVEEEESIVEEKLVLKEEVGVEKEPVKEELPQPKMSVIRAGDSNRTVLLDNNAVSLAYVKSQQNTRKDIEILEVGPGTYKTFR